jgi:hypothetical protein
MSKKETDKKKFSSVIQIDNQIQSFKNKLCYYPIKYALDVNKLDFISSLCFLWEWNSSQIIKIIVRQRY